MMKYFNTREVTKKMKSRYSFGRRVSHRKSQSRIGARKNFLKSLYIGQICDSSEIRITDKSVLRTAKFPRNTGGSHE